MNQQGIFSSTTDTPLTPEGIAQCHAAGKELRGTGVDCIVASPFRRAQHSAEIVAEELGIDPTTILLNEHFAERSFGPLEGTTYSATADLDGTEGVEHSTELIKRVSQGLEYLRSLDADTILVVSHGAVGRALRHLLHPGIPYKGSAKFHNAEVVELL
ncbi:MAG: histidine phosphatase family protein [Candidatus Saccharibacteria bacterium]|nr:histidine phosphatase family protein [Candidatus Saccharibacteria bacterium]